METVRDFIYLFTFDSNITAAMKLKDITSLNKKLWPT